MHTLWAIPATLLAYKIVRWAWRWPRLPVLAVAYAAMLAPLALLQWAQLPRPVIVAPMLVLLAYTGWLLTTQAIDIHEQLRANPPRALAPRRASIAHGWWEAPTRRTRPPEPPTPADPERMDIDSVDDENVADT